MSSKSYSNIIAIAGQMGSGKSSLAKTLCASLSGKRISFGSYVAKEARARGIANERTALQKLGEQLINDLGAAGFLINTLTDSAVDPAELIILDGLRHVSVWRAIQEIATRSLLVYLDVPESLRLERLISRDEKSLTQVKDEVAHFMEQNVPLLKEYADVRLDTEDLDQWSTKVINCIA